MSTRAMYQFRDSSAKGEPVYTVYKHSDGYPEGAARWIGAALTTGLAWPLPRYEADEFAAAFVAANKEPGGSVRLVASDKDTAWRQAVDIEYRYMVEPMDDARDPMNEIGPRGLHVVAFEVQCTDWQNADKDSAWIQSVIFDGPLDEFMMRFKFSEQFSTAYARRTGKAES